MARESIDGIDSLWIGKQTVQGKTRGANRVIIKDGVPVRVQCFYSEDGLKVGDKLTDINSWQRKSDVTTTWGEFEGVRVPKTVSATVSDGTGLGGFEKLTLKAKIKYYSDTSKEFEAVKKLATEKVKLVRKNLK